MRYEGDVYLIRGVAGFEILSSSPSVSDYAKTVGVSKYVEIEFQPYDDKEEKQKRRDHLKSEIEKMNRELNEL